MPQRRSANDADMFALKKEQPMSSQI